jgi:serralysin
MSTRRASSPRKTKGAAGSGAALLLTPAQDIGTSSAVSQVLPSRDSVDLTAILTTAEPAENGYRMVGIPDTFEALDNDLAFTLFAHREPTASALSETPGISQAHGTSGAFVSAWTVDRQTLRVVEAADLGMPSNDVYQWNGTTREYSQGSMAWDFVCSADLAAEKALRHDNCGTAERLFLGGEQVDFGRAWARIVTGPHAGEAWELPRLGKMSFANVVACPHGAKETIVALFDNGSVESVTSASNPSTVFIYVGTKQSEGNEIERAGLTNGRLCGVRVSRGQTLVTEESTDFGLGDASTGYIGNGRFELVQLGTDGDVSHFSGPQLDQAASANGVFRMFRPEDGAWDGTGDDGDALYFVTTDSARPEPNSRLWRLQFDDVAHPEQGGRIDIILTNTPGKVFDNITIDKLGRILVQERTGDNPRVSKICAYTIERGDLREVAQHDPELFQPDVNVSRFITDGDDSAGMIDAQHIFGQGWFLLDAQNHRPHDSDPERVQGGQLLAMHVRPWMRT